MIVEALVGAVAVSGWMALAIHAIRTSGVRAELVEARAQNERSKELLLQEQGERDLQLAMIAKLSDEGNRLRREMGELHEDLARAGLPGAGAAWDDDRLHEDAHRGTPGAVGAVRVSAARETHDDRPTAPGLPGRK